MAITLGEIAVRLTANTAEFISGFGAAGQSAKRFRADLSEHVGAVGQVLERGLAQFGEFGASVGGILGQASSAAGQAILSFGKLGGSMGSVVGIGAGVVAALAVAEAGIIGIAIHSAEGAAKLGEMSEKAGVSSQTLAGLALAGKGVGVETESLVKALGFMGANAVKAAISSDYAHTAFGRLGVSVKDANGHIKDGGQLFTEIVGKIASLPTSEQGFFVKAIFGRGGIEILPLINEGVDKINEKMALAGKFGLGDPDTIAGARKFKETVDEIQAGFEGIALQLTKDLLPSLNYMADELTKMGQDGSLKILVHDMAELLRMTLGVADTFKALFKQIGLILQIPWHTATSQYGKALDDLENFSAQSKQIWADNAAFIHGIYGEKPKNPFPNVDMSGVSSDALARAMGVSGGFADSLPFHAQAMLDSLSPKKHGTVDLSAKGEGKEDTTLARLRERIQALQESRIDWAETANAVSLSESIIAQATQKANAEFKKQEEFAARDKTGRSQKFVAENEALIKFAAASTFYSQQVVKLNEELAKQSDQIIQTTADNDALAAAYQKGGSAIASAGIDVQVSKQAAAIKALKDAGINVGGLEAGLGTIKSGIAAEAVSKLNVELNREDATSAALKPKIDALNAAYLKGADAVRQANIELQVQRFIQDELDKKVVVSTAMIEQKRQALQTADAQAYAGALAQEAAQFNIAAQYDNQITKLQRIADLMRSNGVSTLGVEAQIFDEQNRLLHQWDEWAFKVGTFQQKFRAVMGELVIQGRNAGAAISSAFLTAIDGVESELAKLLTGQKANFKAVFQGLAESITKAEIQKGVGSLAEKFGIKIPGLTPKADGSDTNPFYVILKNGAGLTTIGPSSNIPLFGNPSGSSAQSGGVGGFFSSIASLFGGFRAGGGSMSPGQWYIAGERGPEIVTGPGNVISNASARGGSTYNITHNHNYPNAESRDLFGRTQKQNQARQTRNMRMAYGY